MKSGPLKKNEILTAWLEAFKYLNNRFAGRKVGGRVKKASSPGLVKIVFF